MHSGVRLYWSVTITLRILFTCTHTQHTFTHVLHLHTLALHLHQTSVDTVEVLLKKHEEFEGTSSAHDDRIRSLGEQANKLIHAGHYDTARYTVWRRYVHMYDVYSLPFLP